MKIHRKLFYSVLFLSIVLPSVFFLYKPRTLQTTAPVQNSTISMTPEPTPQAEKRKSNLSSRSIDIFFPYWTLPNEIASSVAPDLDVVSNTPIRYIYFGVTATTDGIDTLESGYGRMKAFSNITRSLPGEKILTLRILNDALANEILQSEIAQELIAREVVQTAQDNNFDGVLLDLEISALPTERIKDRITIFHRLIAEETKRENLTFSTALYGDMFYRSRPYDVAALSKIVDNIYVMAYDFHKSYGTPGPNFPLTRGDVYPYSFSDMIDDFTSSADHEKLTIIFGAFGYEWKVDDENRPLKSARALTLNQTRNKFSPCDQRDCRVVSDSVSQETMTTFKEDDEYTHVAWFETYDSIDKKARYALDRKVSSFAIWAYGYY